MANTLKMLGRSQHGSDVSRVGHGANKKMTQRNLRLRNWSSEQERAVCDPTLTTPTGETRIDGDNSRLATKVLRVASSNFVLDGEVKLDQKTRERTKMRQQHGIYLLLPKRTCAIIPVGKPKGQASEVKAEGLWGDSSGDW